MTVQVLTHPSEPHPLQTHFHIHDEADFVLEIKNPKDKSAMVKNKEFPPKNIQEVYGKHKFIPVNPPELMDFKGGEMVLVAAHHYPSELEDIGEKLEKTAEWEKHKISLKNIKSELHVAKSDPNMSLHPLSGKWE